MVKTIILLRDCTLFTATGSVAALAAAAAAVLAAPLAVHVVKKENYNLHCSVCKSLLINRPLYYQCRACRSPPHHATDIDDDDDDDDDDDNDDDARKPSRATNSAWYVCDRCIDQPVDKPASAASQISVCELYDAYMQAWFDSLAQAVSGSDASTNLQQQQQQHQDVAVPLSPLHHQGQMPDWQIPTHHHENHQTAAAAAAPTKLPSSAESSFHHFACSLAFAMFKSQCQEVDLAQFKKLSTALNSSFSAAHSFSEAVVPPDARHHQHTTADDVAGSESSSPSSSSNNSSMVKLMAASPRHTGTITSFTQHSGNDERWACWFASQVSAIAGKPGLPQRKFSPPFISALRGSPLRYSSVTNKFSFAHQSFFEYFVADHLWHWLTMHPDQAQARADWGARCLTRPPRMLTVVHFLCQRLKSLSEHDHFRATKALYAMINDSKAAPGLY